MKLYKLTTSNMTTYNGFKWKLGETKTSNGKGDLCGPGWLHVYSDPVLAEFMNPIHGNYKPYRLFEAEGSGNFKDDRGCKCGVTNLTLVKELQLINPTIEQRTKFAILVAKEVFKSNKVWNAWADAWLSNKDRSANAANAAADAAYAANAANAAAYAAADAANAAAYAANAANAAAYAAADAANAAAYAVAYAAAYAAADAAYAAADAAYAAADAANPLDLISIAKKALEV